jgi:hypothetical protein
MRKFFYRSILTLIAIALPISVVAAMLSPTAASANTVTVTIQAQSFTHNPTATCSSTPVTCAVPSKGNHVSVLAVLQKPFSHVDRVDIALTYTSTNPVNPHEQVALASGTGFENMSSTPITSRTVTLDASYQPADTELFEGRYDIAFPLWMQSGSATPCRVVITITGTLS